MIKKFEAFLEKCFLGVKMHLNRYLHSLVVKQPG